MYTLLLVFINHHDHFLSVEYTIEDLRYQWTEEEPVEYHLDLLKLPQYEVDGVHTHGCSKEFRTGIWKLQ